MICLYRFGSTTPFLTSWLPCLAFFALVSPTAWAQQAPDSGTTQQQPERQIQTLPAPVAPSLTTAPLRRLGRGGSGGSRDVQVTPAGFRFTGNMLVSDAELQAVVAPLIGKPVDFDGLDDAADALRRVYTARGFVLTDVYLPEQQFSSAGGVVEFAVIEARLGTASVRVGSGSGVSQAYADALVQQALVPGAALSQALLDKPVLLLRDMAGSDAQAAVVPGTRAGEANVEILVTPRGPRFEPYVSADNMGALSAGEYRFAAGVTVFAPLGLGDVLTARVQSADRSGNSLYRLSYSAALGRYGSKFSASYTESAYALGAQFAHLQASGKARVSALAAVQPLIRSRFMNLFASVSLESKGLSDNIGQFASISAKRVSMGRFGVLGNASDGADRADAAERPLGFLGAGTTSFAATVSAGHLRLDAQSALGDVGTPASYGPRTAGEFYKFNVELQRVQYLSGRSSVVLGVIGQLASKNLTSAEKISLGGPQGVRSYPIGEGVGDDGVLVALEYRYLTAARLAGEALSVTAFVDHGSIRRDHVRNATTLNLPTLANSLRLNSAGLGLLLGREGNFVLSAALAKRLGGPPPTTGDPDSATRLWVLLQKWF